MADYTRRERHFVRTEYVLESGTVWGEVRKVLAAIRNDLGEQAAAWDDAARIEARDDEIVIWHEREVPRSGVPQPQGGGS